MYWTTFLHALDNLFVGGRECRMVEKQFGIVEKAVKGLEGLVEKAKIPEIVVS
jgi:hypothetical protein